MSIDPNPSPFAGLAPNLIPNPPAAMPEAPSVGDAMANLSPFTKELDIDAIVKNLTLDRPLTLYIPNREKYPNYVFRIINDTPQEMAQAQRQGWMPVDDPELKGLFENKVSGIDKTGKVTRPILMARPKEINDMIIRRQQKQLQDHYKGMDPKTRQFNSKYAETEQTVSAGLTKGAFSFANIKVMP